MGKGIVEWVTKEKSLVSYQLLDAEIRDKCDVIFRRASEDFTPLINLCSMLVVTIRALMQKRKTM